MQVEISRCVAVDLACEPRADANHFTIACACQCTASVRLSVAVLVSTWLIIAAASSVLPARQGLSRSNSATPSSMKRCCQRLGLTCPAHDHHRADTRRTEQHDLAVDDSPHTSLHGRSVASSTGFMMKIRSVENAVVVRLPGFAICRHDRPAMFT
jgi:hypothetical protein